MRILAVDDDPVMLDLLGTALENSGFEDITFAASAEDALELIEVACLPYDVFLLDVMLPEISGIEVCRRLRALERYRATPVIMITGSRARDMMSRAFDAGATDFVSKPFDGLELVTRIRLAAMLNDSLERERLNSEALADMERLADVSFDERFDLKKGPGVKGFLALENELLRHADALYEMTLFSVQIDNALGLYRGSRPAQYRASVDAVSRVLSNRMDTDRTRFAYAGRGGFICVAHATPSLDLAELQRSANTLLMQGWEAFAIGHSFAPTLNMRQIEGPKLWSGKAAADAIRNFQGRADLTVQAAPFEVDGLFERLSVRIMGR
jgi:CheY-like chemotaxis protein